MPVGENMRRRRLFRNLTLEEVAQAVGLSKQTVQKYESGVIANIPAENVERIAAVLGCTPAALMGWEESAPRPQEELSGIYLSYAKEAQDNGIHPDDIRLAIETIKRLRGESSK